MTQFPTIDTGAAPPSPRRPRGNVLIVLGALACLAAVVVFIARQEVESSAERFEAVDTTPPVAAKPAPAAKPDALGPTSKQILIASDGEATWTSPTDGPPLDLVYLPPGVQIILAFRPAALAQHAEGDKVLAAVGPLGQRGIRTVEQATGRPFGELDQLLVGWQTNEQGEWSFALVARVKNEMDAEPSREVSSLPPLTSYLPPDHEGRVIVVASPAEVEEIKALAGNPPPLRRELQRLVDRSDSTRDFTLLVAPNFLFGDGHTLFSGSAARLRDPLFWFLGDSLAAASLSGHWDADFFLEFRAVPTLDALPDQVADQFLDRVYQLPGRVEEYVVGLSPVPYGRRVVARFPAMVRKLVTYTRASYDGDEVVLRCYLPAIAGHNLLMGAELTLAESPSAATRPIAPTVPPTLSAAERLQKRTTLRFPRDTLEAALDMLAQDLGVEIIVLGRDLQLEGITRNQSFGLDLQDRPAQEILVEILRLANPDKSASGPGDERQKLVYVIKPREPGRPDAIFITTRSQARQRGDRLPDAFEPR